MLNIIRDRLDALLHPSARYDVLTRARHRVFIAPRLLGSLAVGDVAHHHVHLRLAIDRQRGEQFFDPERLLRVIEVQPLEAVQPAAGAGQPLDVREAADAMEVSRADPAG